jgi:hypothetical protein
LVHDCGGRFQPNPNAAALVDKGTLGGYPRDDNLGGGQYRRHPITTLKRSRVRS